MIKNEMIKELIKKYNENKLSHVFLIETNNQSEALKDIKNLVKFINCSENSYHDTCSKCNLCHLIDTELVPTLEIVYPDGQAIKKEQMEALKLHFKTVPFLTKYHVYIIMQAEKFNASSANTMLKFIEEPEKDIIGFLLTNNRENVIHTIKSRCEIIKSFYEEEEKVQKERFIALARTYLSKIEIEKNKSIVYNKIVLDEKLEREEYISFFKILLEIYLDIYYEKNEEEMFKSLETLNKRLVLQRITLVNEMIERLNYNVNINLLLDDFVLRLEEFM